MKKMRSQRIRIGLAMIIMIALCLCALSAFDSYHAYLDELIYQERLSQMSEVTAELYASMDLLLRHEWETAQLICDWLISGEVTPTAIIASKRLFFSAEISTPLSSGLPLG